MSKFLNLHEESIYLQGVRDILLRLRYDFDMYLIPNIKCRVMKSEVLPWEESSKTIIDKAYRWLEENIDAYSKVVIVENSIPTIVLTEDFKTNFKKAMEEHL